MLSLFWSVLAFPPTKPTPQRTFSAPNHPRTGHGSAAARPAGARCPCEAPPRGHEELDDRFGTIGLEVRKDECVLSKEFSNLEAFHLTLGLWMAPPPRIGAFSDIAAAA